MTTLLPVKFDDLSPFVGEWAIPTRSKRFKKRVTSEFSGIQKFYEAILPRMEDIVGHLNTFPVAEVEALSSENKNLLYMAFSFMEVAASVECWNAPDNEGLELDKVTILL